MKVLLILERETNKLYKKDTRHKIIKNLNFALWKQL